MFKSEVLRLKADVLEVLAAHGVRVYGFGISHEDCVTLARGGEFGAPPFALSCVDQEDGGGGEGDEFAVGRCESEFETLKTGLFYSHVGDLRSMSANLFADWYFEV